MGPDTQSPPNNHMHLAHSGVEVSAHACGAHVQLKLAQWSAFLPSVDWLLPGVGLTILGF